MGVRSTNSTQSFIDNFYRSGTDAALAGGAGATTPITASGGTTVSPGDGFKYHFITSPGQNLVVASGNDTVQYIAIAGGGGGGDRGNGGGGGGAGGLLTTWPGPGWTGGTSRNRGSALTVSAQTYTISIGAGGRGGDEGNAPANGAVGGDTTIAGPDITTITVKGGGNGYAPGGDGGDGGSGGGANGPGSGGAGQNFPGPTQQGYPGGGVPVSMYGGGGGGSSGAGADGGNGVIAPGGNGDGFSSIPPSYGTPGPSGPLRYFCGGGGGGSTNANPSPGGYGGGGSGARQSSDNTASAGADSTGGGGGGGSDGSNNGGPNSDGGDGIVILRYSV